LSKLDHQKGLGKTGFAVRRFRLIVLQWFSLIDQWRYRKAD